MKKKLVKLRFTEKAKEPIFGFKDAVRAAEVAPGVLANWLNRDIVKLGAMVQEGARKMRRFSFLDLLSLSILTALTRQGLDISVAVAYLGDVQLGLGCEEDFLAISKEKSVATTADATLEDLAQALPGVAFHVVDMRAIRDAFPRVDFPGVMN